MAPALAMVGHVGEEAAVVGFDTYSELDVIRRSAVRGDWEVLEDVTMPVRGLGSANLGPKVKIPLRYRYMCQQPGDLAVWVTPDESMPDGVDVLVETSSREELGMVFDQRNKRLELWERACR